MSGWDEVYGLSLRKLLGDSSVRLPPPSFSTAIKLSDSNSIEVVGIDMDEQSFTEAYTSNVSMWHLYKRGRLEKHMFKKGITGSTPEEISINMERSIREIDGFAKLEEQRVSTMAENIRSYSDKNRILAVIEIPNVDSLVKLLKES